MIEQDLGFVGTALQVANDVGFHAGDLGAAKRAFF
jgi:hypothetical protein